MGFIEPGRKRFSMTLALSFSKSAFKYIALDILVFERHRFSHLNKFGPKVLKHLKNQPNNIKKPNKKATKKPCWLKLFA